MSGFWRAVAFPIRLYKRFLSPWLPPACRFEPTCSVYAAEAIERHGLSGLAGAAADPRAPSIHDGGMDLVPRRGHLGADGGTRSGTAHVAGTLTAFIDTD
jgi:putative membrane protein insertion efficiency factor